MAENKLTLGSNMRWESMRMILPEHKDAWEKRRASSMHVPKPILDEHKWDELELLLHEAFEHRIFLEFTYWEDGHFITFTGECVYINMMDKQFHVKNKEDICYIKFGCLKDLKVI
ncbi:YolD-like protein [Sinobaca qinghaiensis]|uniref:YolD-like protein n=1 Tax=Sinobaca qinghaiensis TaxID=342944 RepID=A0A419V5I3_9BACL|nr:YolD-like family protein [Sinobaca qinghaiensis]RKD75208.1 YolD-like protein [Sinobaca qinghaiensis]